LSKAENENKNKNKSPVLSCKEARRDEKLGASHCHCVHASQIEVVERPTFLLSRDHEFIPIKVGICRKGEF
jgi:hypothetical protein